MAPILAFTAEEIWHYLPRQDHEAESIHLALLPEIRSEWKNEPLSDNWKRILEVRGEVTKALEEARAEKKIGHPLDAAVILSAGKPLYDLLAPYADDLRAIFIVSRAELVNDNTLDDAAQAGDAIAQLSVRVEPATAKKCERCWIHEPSVGSVAGHPTICGRCGSVLKTML
jgi:isoleucyl-tRNA synthetase